MSLKIAGTAVNIILGDVGEKELSAELEVVLVFLKTVYGTANGEDGKPTIAQFQEADEIRFSATPDLARKVADDLLKFADMADEAQAKWSITPEGKADLIDQLQKTVERWVTEEKLSNVGEAVSILSRAAQKHAKVEEDMGVKCSKIEVLADMLISAGWSVTAILQHVRDTAAADREVDAFLGGPPPDAPDPQVETPAPETPPDTTTPT